MLQQSDETPAKASLCRYTVDIPQALIERLDKLAHKARRLMKCDVTRATLFRAAILFWLATVAKASSSTIREEIRQAAPLPYTLLHRCKPTWSSELDERLAKLGERLDARLAYSATGVRSALVLAALRAWLLTAEDEPLKASNTIRAGLLKRGRKPIR